MLISMQHEFKQKEYVILQIMGQEHSKQVRQHAENHMDCAGVCQISPKQTE